MRVKPKSGYLELDVKLNTEHNFNRYNALKWGDALRTAKEVQNDSATFGMASGFPGVKYDGVRRVAFKDHADRENDLQNEVADFEDDSEIRGKALDRQTLGGQIIRHDSPDETGKPFYFVGAFRGSELHLTKITGTVQMRPQFHHVDAEAQRNRLASTRPTAALDGTVGAVKNDDLQARQVHVSYKNLSANPKGELEQREADMRKALQTAAEEQWTRLDYVDEDDEDAYEVWRHHMFVEDTSQSGCVTLRSAMNNDEYLDAISAPGKESPTRRRRRPSRKKETADMEEEEAQAGANDQG